MGDMRLGCGSEWQLLRMLGRHRTNFNRLVLARLAEDRVQSAGSIEWWDAPFDPRNKLKDGEWKSVDFLPDHGGQPWRTYWPDPRAGVENRNGAPSWDAIGRLHRNNEAEWLLVEAKAHEEEVSGGTCRAGDSSRPKITDQLRQTYLYCGGDVAGWSKAEAVWLGDGYQMANRLACLRFLVENQLPARLLLVYFVCDEFPGQKCPEGELRWNEVVAALQARMGLPKDHHLRDRVHYIFPHVSKR